ncbi:MAG: hypothetical protein KDA85_17620 [Planctomycetaceae bacterium]|nr:hypothetical protein [Planctomycetaceae bacterium]
MPQDHYGLLFLRDVAAQSARDIRNTTASLSSVTCMRLVCHTERSGRSATTAEDATKSRVHQLFESGEFSAAAEWLKCEASRLSTNNDDQSAVVCWQEATLCLLEAGLPFQASQTLQRAIRLNLSAGYDPGARQHVLAVRCALATQDIEAAVQWGELAESAAQRESQSAAEPDIAAASLAPVLAVLAEIHFRCGRFAKAARQFHLAGRLFAQTGQPEFAAVVSLLSYEAKCSVAQGCVGLASGLEDIVHYLSLAESTRLTQRRSQLLQCVRAAMPEQRADLASMRAACWN